MPVHFVSDPTDATLQQFRQMADQDLARQNLMIVDSDKVVERLLIHHVPLRALLCTESFLTFFQMTYPSLCQQIDVFTAPRQVMETIIGHRLHHGVIAIAERPNNVQLEQLGPRVVALNGVNNSENVGVIARNAHAFGFDSMIVDGESCSPWVRRAIRVSMGSVFTLKIHITHDLPKVLKKLDHEQYDVIGTSIGADSQSIRSMEQASRMVVVLGSEGQGMTEAAMASCNKLAQIPMAPGIDSLNVSVASGIVLNHFSDL